MGRIAFYSIAEDKDIALADSQPELIRGITHSSKGDNIFISIGDISCQRLNAEDLNIIDYVQIVENIDERQHKAHCERSYTLSYQHYNCVLNINMSGKNEPNEEQNAPMRLSNLDTNILENYGEGEIAFTQNTVPFDFDGNRLMWMQYNTKDQRIVYIYDFGSKQRTEVL